MEQFEWQNSADRFGQIAKKAAPQAHCFWCERLHDSKHPLSVCATCVSTARSVPFPMGSLEMSGSYPLTSEAIETRLTRRAPGNYALGYLDGDTFVVFYVGRSDSDVKQRLQQWVGAQSEHDRYVPARRAPWAVGSRGPLSLDVAQAAEDSGYTRFAYSYAHSAEAAFAKEWRNYDDFGGSDGLDNIVPPSRRQGSLEEPLERGFESDSKRPRRPNEGHSTSASNI
jgi:hypothetical protein